MSKNVIGSLQVRLEAADAQFGADLQRAGKKLRRFKQAASDYGAIGSSLTRVGVVLGGIGAAAVHASTTLGKGMANVASLIPGSTSRVSELKDAVQQLSIAHGKDSQDLAAGLYQTISAFGDRAGRTMEILRIASTAATAGVATTSDAIRLTSAVTRAYGDDSAAAVQQVADLAFVTVRLGQTSFPELGAAIGRVTPKAAALGVRQEELFAGFSALAGVTGSTAEVSTQLKGVLDGLLKPSKGMTAAMAALGAADAETLIETHGLVNAIDMLIGTTDGSHESIGELFTSTEALTAILQITGGSADAFKMHLQEMESASGAADEAFRAQTTGVGEAVHTWGVLLARLRAAGAQLGDVLVPILLRVWEGLRPLGAAVVAAIEGLGTLSPQMQVIVVAAAALVPILAAVAAGMAAIGLQLVLLVQRFAPAARGVWNIGRALAGLPPRARRHRRASLRHPLWRPRLRRGSGC